MDPFPLYRVTDGGRKFISSRLTMTAVTINITNNLATNTRAIIVSKEQQTRDSSADKIDERYRLNHAIVVHVQAACQAVVCGTMCLQAACLRNPYI